MNLLWQQTEEEKKKMKIDENSDSGTAFLYAEPSCSPFLLVTAFTFHIHHKHTDRKKGGAQRYEQETFASSFESQIEGNPLDSCCADGYLCTILPHAKQKLDTFANKPNSWCA